MLEKVLIDKRSDNASKCGIRRRGIVIARGHVESEAWNLVAR